MKKSAIMLAIVFCILASVSISFAEDAPTLFGLKWGSSSKQLMNLGILLNGDMKKTNPVTGSILYILEDHKDLKIDQMEMDRVVLVFNHLDQLQGIIVIFDDLKTFDYLHQRMDKLYAPGDSTDVVFDRELLFTMTEWDTKEVFIKIQFLTEDKGTLTFSNIQYYEVTKDLVDKKAKGLINEM